jgi:putative Holliday junction resolvase
MSVQTLLAFDYGQRRIGVAVGQTLTQSARPLVVLKMNKNKKIPWQQIHQYITEWQPQALVLGLSQHVDGSENKITQAIIKFKTELEQRYQLPVHLVDETLTSVAAQAYLQDMRQKEEFIDAVAAKIILETWLQG